MAETKGQIEGRIAVHLAFGVEEHRAVRADQDILGADVAVRQGDLAAGQIGGQGPHP